MNDDLISKLGKYFRLVNYLSAAQLYLKDNFFLEKELSKEHIKKRILGHWGTVPGLNFIYMNLNLIIKKTNQDMMLIIGPGHGYPALLSNLYVEGTMGEFYPEYKISKESAGKLIKNFSWPGGFPSHANPETPGVVLEGGELGYSLSTAFGTILDNPDLITACIVGDGEAETGPLAAAWHSAKFVNPKESGAVLPIVHINKYKISGPTIYGTMSDEELDHLFRGYGYNPIFLHDQNIFEDGIRVFDDAYSQIKEIQRLAREENIIDKPKWPVILMISKKGWTGPIEFQGKMIEDSFRSHGIPLEKPQDDEEFQALKNWLECYNVQELFTDDFQIDSDILDIIPSDEFKMGRNKHANNEFRYEMNLPQTSDYEIKFEKDFKTKASSTEELGKYLRDVISMNPESFRIFCPDETESNKLHSLFEATKRGYMWPVPEGSENISKEGRVMEMLSEHTLQGWLQGYTMTGRQGVFISYEAFMMIVASMVDQYSKFLKQSENIKWRKPIPAMNFVLTSTSWRQDHNGFSHQNPGFISAALN
ncbi:MAG TPA: phosphoketolase family protein, partial [Candidatus Dojkabacteria bacterium]